MGSSLSIKSPLSISNGSFIAFLKASQKAVLNRSFLIQYGASLGSGIAGFVGLALLGRVLHEQALYSTTAAILATFSTYFVFFDLGYTSELMRDLSEAPQEERERGAAQGFLSLLYLRLFLCVFVIPLSLVQGYFSGADGQHTLAFGLFSLSFLFFSFFSTWDSLAFGEGRPTRAVTTKLLRLVASLCLPAVVFGFQILELNQLFVAYLAILGLLSLGAGVIYRREIRRLFRFGWLPERTGFQSFLIRCMKSSLTPSLSMLGAFLIQTALYKGEGLDSLSTYVAAVALISPLSTMMQTLSSLVQRELSLSSHLDLSKTRSKVYRTSGLMAIIGLLGVLCIACFYKLGLVGYFLKHVESSFILIFALLAFQVTLVSIQVQFFNVLQFRKKYRLLFKIGLLLTLGGVPLVCYFSITAGVLGSLYSGSLVSVCSLFVYYWHFRRETTSFAEVK
jgi:O-antigen/teichoic acid export membrane protein